MEEMLSTRNEIRCRFTYPLWRFGFRLRGAAGFGEDFRMLHPDGTMRGPHSRGDRQSQIVNPRGNQQVWC